ncbi:Cro/CI family transcriptional regulator [Pseudomonas siliginis]|uniref:Cro/CI family transcriptional regulator n=1 Tax=Pseudomonas siliginis TaxID=2842346 RepID=UPI00339050F0
MNSPLPSMQEAAQEAEFQLLAAKDLLEWQCALSSAIHLDHLHNGGKSAGALAELAKYFSDTGFGGVYSAIDQFKQLGKSEPAPQNTQYEKEARIPLKEFAKGRQHVAAQELGVQQAAISKAIRVGREIYVTPHADGSYTATEVRAFPSSTAWEGEQ